MRTIRLLQTTFCVSALLIGAAQASPSVVVNYEALNSLPLRGSAGAAVPPILTPPSMVRKHAVPNVPAFAMNAPAGAGPTAPAIFERGDTLYNGSAADPDTSASRAFGTTFTPPAEGIANASPAPALRPPAVGSRPAPKPQQTAMLTPPQSALIAPAPHPASLPPHMRAYNADAAADTQTDYEYWNRHARTVGEVLFKNRGYDTPDLDQSQLSALDQLARQICSTQRRILLRAFGGVAGDDSHEAHRMALRRGLTVRRYLIARGVSSTLIDVTAVGGATDGGPLDRVDVVASNS